MKKYYLHLYILLCLFNLSGCTQSKNNLAAEPSWSFVFMTDIHVEYRKQAAEGFKQAIKSAEELGPDFILTGGDLIADALGVSYESADSQYNLYNSITSQIAVPVHNTIGNHEIFGWYPESGVPRNHAEFGKLMFENRIGKRFYSFMHNGWCFIIFDSLEEIAEGKGYYGHINQQQIDWLNGLLKGIDKETPIVVSTHIPFITAQTQLVDSSLAANSEGLVINNSKIVYDILKEYNLKMVLQGHLHIYEDIFIYDTHFITGGAVCGAWWTGAREGTEEGYLKINIKGNNFTTEYVDYGWEVTNNK